MRMAVVVELVWLRRRFEKVEEWNQGERVWRRDGEGGHKCAIHLCDCCCWDLQLNWSVGGGEETLAGIAAFVAGNAGLRAGCREILDFCRFHASTFCVFCLWRREEIAGWCLALFDCGQQGLFCCC